MGEKGRTDVGEAQDSKWQSMEESWGGKTSAAMDDQGGKGRKKKLGTIGRWTNVEK